MNNSTWNPTRRNRKIGTEDSGFSKNNKLLIPSRWDEDKVFWEKLNNPVKIPLYIKEHRITLFVEPTLDSYIHASTPNDIRCVLELIPIEHLQEIELIVLRQPKKKEEILKPVWGRFVYYADLGKYSGAGIYLEAIKKNAEISWNKKLSPFNQKELKAIERDGHEIEISKRAFKIKTTVESVRNTQLFRTLPHEIGHAVDYLDNCIIPQINSNSEEESEYIYDKFRSKPSLDKEEFANRYAREFYSQYRNNGMIPFPKIFDKEYLINNGLDLKWFGIKTS